MRYFAIRSLMTLRVSTVCRKLNRNNKFRKTCMRKWRRQHLIFIGNFKNRDRKQVLHTGFVISVERDMRQYLQEALRTSLGP